jgi:hypothetical protein
LLLGEHQDSQPWLIVMLPFGTESPLSRKVDILLEIGPDADRAIHFTSGFPQSGHSVDHKIESMAARD